MTVRAVKTCNVLLIVYNVRVTVDSSGSNGQASLRALAGRVGLGASSKLGAEIIGRALQFLLVYLTQRTLGPATYGQFAFALAVGLVLAQLTDWGLQLTVTQQMTRKEADPAGVAGDGLSMKLALALGAGAVLLLVNQTRPPEVQAATFALGLAMILGSFVEFFGYAFRGLQRVEYDATLILFTRALTVTLGISALHRGLGLGGLAAAYLIGACGPRIALCGIAMMRETATPTTQVFAAVPPGRYLLSWDLVQERVTWFSSLGESSAETAVEVVRGSSGAVLPRLPKPFRIVPLIRPPRLELWRAGLEMWRDRPLLGVGPDNFRHVYGPRLGLTEFDDQIQASSFYVETVRKLPRQVDTAKRDCPAVVGLGRNVRGGTRPRLSCGRSSL